MVIKSHTSLYKYVYKDQTCYHLLDYYSSLEKYHIPVKQTKRSFGGKRKVFNANLPSHLILRKEHVLEIFMPKAL